MGRGGKKTGGNAVARYPTRSGQLPDVLSVPLAFPAKGKPPAKGNTRKAAAATRKAALNAKAPPGKGKKGKTAEVQPSDEAAAKTKARKKGKTAEVQASDENSLSSFETVPRKKGGMNYSEGKRYADYIEHQTNKSFKDCGDRVALVRRVKLVMDDKAKTILITDMNVVDYIQCKHCGWMMRPSTCSKHTYLDCKHHPWHPKNRSRAGKAVVDTEEVVEEDVLGEERRV